MLILGKWSLSLRSPPRRWLERPTAINPHLRPLPRLPDIGARDAMDAVMKGLGERGAKRPATALGRDSAAAGSNGSSASDRGAHSRVLEALGSVPSIVGEGEHERPLMEAMLLGMRNLSMEAQELKAAVITSWELPRDSLYIEQAMRFKDEYIRKCRTVKGKGQDLGHMKNYVFLGLMMAGKADKRIGEQHQGILEELVGKHLRDEDGEMDISNAPKTAHLVGHCQVSRSKKKGFVNIHLRGQEGARLMQVFQAVWAQDGKQQWDPTAPNPVHRDLKLALEEVRRRKGD